MFLNRLVTL